MTGIRRIFELHDEYNPDTLDLIKRTRLSTYLKITIELLKNFKITFCSTLNNRHL